MARASIPVDLFNPGQVFACLGFIEAADILLGDAEGGFDWADETNVCFLLQATGNENPVAAVLRFLAEAKALPAVPRGNHAEHSSKRGPADGGQEKVIEIPWFPDRKPDRMALPVCLQGPQGSLVHLSHWGDGSRRNRFKLYAGNRSAHKITCDMLSGVSDIWREKQEELVARPFDVLIPIGGSFNFDPRGAWNPLDAGYSPDAHEHRTLASPVVQMLAAWGLEHARPDEYDTRKTRYGAWSGLVSPMLARAALGGVGVAVPTRSFRFVLNLSGKNKIVTFAQEEVTSD